MENTLGVMEMFTKENGDIVSDMVKEVIDLLMAMFILESMSGGE
jgi:hypothetical protein